MTRRPHPLDRLVAPLEVEKAETWRECNSSTCAVHWRVTLKNQHGQSHTQEGTYPTQPQHNSQWFDFWKAVSITISEARAFLIAKPIVDAITRPAILQDIVWAGVGKKRWQDELRWALEYDNASPDFIDMILGLDAGIFAMVQGLCNQRLYANR